MKNLISKLLISLILLAAFAISGCSNCSDENPRARIKNDGTDKASVQIQTSGGNTININNIATGTTSDFASYAAGTVTFTITVDKNTYVYSVNMENCFEYDIEIDANNNVKSVPTDRNA